MHCTKYLAFSVSERKNIITPIKPPLSFPLLQTWIRTPPSDKLNVLNHCFCSLGSLCLLAPVQHDCSDKGVFIKTIDFLLTSTMKKTKEPALKI